MAEQPTDYLIVNGERVPQPAIQTLPDNEVTTKEGIGRKILRAMLWSPRITLMVLIGVPGLILSTQWKYLDKHFPQVNELIHSDVTDTDDVNYQSYKLHQASDAYQKSIAACNADKPDLDQCRAAMIAAAPALDDLKKRADKLAGAFRQEETQRNMPQACKETGEALFRAYDVYVAAEKGLVSILQHSNNTPASLTQASAEIDALAKQEDVAVNTINTPWPKECDDY